MGDIQKIIIQGASYVILSEEDYQDLIDGVEAAAIKERIAAGVERVWPEEVALALMRGEESPVRILRRHFGLSAAALAEKAGLSPSYLSEIESRKKDGSFDAMKAIAEALDVSLDHLA